MSYSIKSDICVNPVEQKNKAKGTILYMIRISLSQLICLHLSVSECTDLLFFLNGYLVCHCFCTTIYLSSLLLVDAYAVFILLLIINTMVKSWCVYVLAFL